MKRAHLFGFCLSLYSALCSSQTMFGDWIFDRETSGMPFIATANESNGYFGKWCDDEVEKCFWILAISLECNSGKGMPALLSAPSGALAVNLICAGPTQIGKTRPYRYIIKEHDQIADVVRSGAGRLSFAIATEGDSFRVSRFTLSGGSAAVDRMERAEVEYLRTKQRGTKDRTL